MRIATGASMSSPRVIIDNTASRTHTVVEVNGRDRPGLLFALTRALTAQNVQIASAQIATYGESAVDVFYIKDVFGLKIARAAKREQIRAALLDVLGSFTTPAAQDRARAARAGGAYRNPAGNRCSRRMRLLSSIATVGGYTMVSRILGFARDILIAAALGTGPVADAFFVAFKIPNSFRRLFAEGAFAAAFVPLFTAVWTGEGLIAARRFGAEGPCGPHRGAVGVLLGHADRDALGDACLRTRVCG